MGRFRSRSRLGITLWAAALAAACSSGTPPAESPEEPPPLEDEPGAASPGPVAPASSGQVQQGMDAIQAGDFEKARGILEQAVAAAPGDAQAAFYLGVALHSLGDAEGAVARYEKALALDPNLAEARVNLSAALLDAGQADRALAVVEQALASAPNDPALLLNRAMALSHKGDAKAAAAAFEKAVRANPGDPETRFLYAQALEQAGESGKALTELKRLGESDDLEVLASAARLLGRLGAFDECVASLDRALQKKPAAELYVQRGLCKHGKKDDGGALKDYEASVAADPGFAAGYFYLGQHKRAQGDKKGAKAALGKAVELDPNGGIGKAAQKALKGL
jgi:tetratricopeptide (TPR) repeat protein